MVYVITNHTKDIPNFQVYIGNEPNFVYKEAAYGYLILLLQKYKYDRNFVTTVIASLKNSNANEHNYITGIDYLGKDDVYFYEYSGTAS